tara:strand:- start:611 stop:952 length:342 start_codon:yes stop_codon:yes gene_type:complete
MDETKTHALEELAQKLGRVVLEGFDIRIIAAELQWLDTEQAFTFASNAGTEESSRRNSLYDLRGFLCRAYDAGHGTQYLEGTVWLSDGSWMERAEYDGAERWVHRTCPRMPRA